MMPHCFPASVCSLMSAWCPCVAFSSVQSDSFMPSSRWPFACDARSWVMLGRISLFRSSTCLILGIFVFLPSLSNPAGLTDQESRNACEVLTGSFCRPPLHQTRARVQARAFVLIAKRVATPHKFHRESFSCPPLPAASHSRPACSLRRQSLPLSAG